MSNSYDRPHYMYIARDNEGKRALTIMTKKGETVAEPLNVDSAMKWARDFLAAAIELHKLEVTREGNKDSRQTDLVELLEERKVDATENGRDQDRSGH